MTINHTLTKISIKIPHLSVKHRWIIQRSVNQIKHSRLNIRKWFNIRVWFNISTMDVFLEPRHLILSLLYTRFATRQTKIIIRNANYLHGMLIWFLSSAEFHVQSKPWVLEWFIGLAIEDGLSHDLWSSGIVSCPKPLSVLSSPSSSTTSGEADPSLRSGERLQ